LFRQRPPQLCQQAPVFHSPVGTSVELLVSTTALLQPVNKSPAATALAKDKLAPTKLRLESELGFVSQLRLLKNLIPLIQ
jgi:hypothetical protein